MARVALYTTEHCSLCDQVLDLLLSMPEAAGVRLEVVDIAGDDALMARYGERIPVLRANDRELRAPFDRDAIAKWLQAID